jgi:tetratricopeptide (TPR) repeat protein
MSHECIGRYRILERLGAGGMGEVYRACDLVLDRDVALKWVSGRAAADPLARARLIREARAASVLDHPGIAVIHEIGLARAPGQKDGEEQLFIVMGFCEGETLEQKLGRRPLTVHEIVDLATQVAEALACAHGASVVHRDIKPGNLIVAEDGRVKIVDFGLARAEGRAGEDRVTGTLAYMSPEQTRGESIDPRADVWSLGVVIQEMLTGLRPFEGEDEWTLVRAIREARPRRLDANARIPAALVKIVETCLAKDPRDRYASAAQLHAALRALEICAPDHPEPDGAGDHGDARPTVQAHLLSLVARFANPFPTVRLVVTLVLVAAGAVMAVRGGWLGGPGPTGPPDPNTIAVFPFEPVVDDAGLAALSREVAVTLSANLDGIGGLKTVNGLTLLAEIQPDAEHPSLEDARATTERLGAARFLYGGLTMAGAAVRLDATLYALGASAPVARISVTADAEDHTALSDSVAIALLDQLWRHDPPAVPSLSAVSQSSVPVARRAHLEGELALARADMPAAVESFERAFAADTTFWWAYWRSLYPRLFSDARIPADTAVVRKVVEHRFELPEPDRRLVDTWTIMSRTQKVEQLQELLSSFRTYSPGWWEYANFLVHFGPYLGYGIEDARTALEGFLALNPDFSIAWDHLLWVAVAQHDPAAAARALHEVERLTVGVESRTTWLRVLRLRADVAGSGRFQADSLSSVVDFVLSSPPALAVALSSGFVADGHPSAQLQLNRAIGARTPGRQLTAALWQGEALAWAARGAWGSALEAADRWSTAAVGADGVLGAYTLGVAGAALGAVTPAEALRRRPVAANELVRLGPDERAGIAWLDGVLAYIVGDRSGVRSARAVLAGDSATFGSVLDRSLAALAADAEGDRKRAARHMVQLEMEIADRGSLRRIGELHPLFTTLNRLLAVGWLRALGDDAGAARLLSWHEAIPGPPLLQAWQRSIGEVSLLDRAEIAESVGDTARARMDYARFLRTYDVAVSALRPLLERAETALHRIASDVPLRR